MAKKVKGNARTTLEGVNDSLTSLEQKFEQNKKYIYWALGIIAGIILAVLAYVYLIMKPAKENDRIATSKADMALFDQGKSDEALKQYQAIANNSSYATADRAAHMAAILLYQQALNENDAKKATQAYQKAADLLEKCDAEGNLTGPAAKSLLGDCYVNLKKYDKAIAAFDDAISICKDNKEYAPEFILKKARVLHATKNYKGELEAYQLLKDEYPQTAQLFNVNIDKYLERAKALTEQAK